MMKKFLKKQKNRTLLEGVNAKTISKKWFACSSLFFSSFPFFRRRNGAVVASSRCDPLLFVERETREREEGAIWGLIDLSQQRRVMSSEDSHVVGKPLWFFLWFFIFFLLEFPFAVLLIGHWILFFSFFFFFWGFEVNEFSMSRLPLIGLHSRALKVLFWWKSVNFWWFGLDDLVGFENV